MWRTLRPRLRGQLRVPGESGLRLRAADGGPSLSPGNTGASRSQLRQYWGDHPPRDRGEPGETGQQPGYRPELPDNLDISQTNAAQTNGADQCGCRSRA